MWIRGHELGGIQTPTEILFFHLLLTAELSLIEMGAKFHPFKLEVEIPVGK